MAHLDGYDVSLEEFLDSDLTIVKELKKEREADTSDVIAAILLSMTTFINDKLSEIENTLESIDETLHSGMSGIVEETEDQRKQIVRQLEDIVSHTNDIGSSIERLKKFEY